MTNKSVYKLSVSRSDIKILFGNQLKNYRLAAGLTQEEYAGLLDTGQSYINKLEQGKLNPSLMTMQTHADLFGVMCYQLMDPTFPIPLLSKMPAEIRKAAKVAEKNRLRKETEKQGQRDAGEPIYQIGRAKHLHQLIADGFFDEPRTSKDAYEKMHGKLGAGQIPKSIQKAIGTITGTLRNGRFAKLLDKLEPVAGNSNVRFVLKDPKAVAYVGEAEGMNAMAAEGDEC